MGLGIAYLITVLHKKQESNPNVVVDCGIVFLGGGSRGETFDVITCTLIVWCHCEWQPCIAGLHSLLHVRQRSKERTMCVRRRRQGSLCNLLSSHQQQIKGRDNERADEGRTTSHGSFWGSFESNFGVSPTKRPPFHTKDLVGHYFSMP